MSISIAKKPKVISMKILFAGTPAIAVPALQKLTEMGFVSAVLTSQDRPTGRGQVPSMSDVKKAALDLSLPVLQPAKLDAEFRKIVSEFKFDLLVCVAFGKIFGPKFLDLFPKGGINFHPSLLPQFRGPSPISSVILAGCQESGLTVQRLAAGMDEGNIILQKSFKLKGHETTGTLSEFCAVEGANMLSQTLQLIAEGKDIDTQQESEKASYCHLVSKQDGLIHWDTDAALIERMIRAWNPWPRAYTSWNNTPLYLLESELVSSVQNGSSPGLVLGMDTQHGILVQTGNGVIALRRLQLHARKPMDFVSFLNGARGFFGSILGDNHD